MKIYHKFLLYQNKLLKPYIRIILGLVEALTYLASLTLIVGVIYEHGFPLSVDEIAKIQVLYKAVWIIFLIDVTLHISLEYRSTKKQYRKLAWILSGLLYLTLIPVIFHRPEEEGAILQFWEFLDGKFYHLILLLVFFFIESVQRIGTSVGAAYQPVFDIGSQFSGYHSYWHGIIDVAKVYGEWHYLGRFAVYGYECGVCDGASTGGCVDYIYDRRARCYNLADSNRWFGSDDINEFLCDVLYGKYLSL